MYRVLSGGEMRQCDTRTFASLGFPSYAVMEVAGREVALLVEDRFREVRDRPILVVTGDGNNAGDGYVAARHLLLRGFDVAIVSVCPMSALSGDAELAANAWRSMGQGVTSADSVSGFAPFFENPRPPALIIDAIFGTGFRGEFSSALASLLCELGRLIGLHGSKVLAVDVPSGVHASGGSLAAGTVKADVTLAIQCLKHAHIFHPACDYCGEVWVTDVGILVEESIPCVALLETADIVDRLATLHSLGPTAHKGTRGRVAVVGGSQGRYGAAKLSCESALMTGAGLVHWVLPDQEAGLLAPTVSEVMVESDTSSDFFKVSIQPGDTSFFDTVSSVVVGPGMAQGQERFWQVLKHRERSSFPLVIDGDALNIIARSEVMPVLDREVVMTPHPAEAARLLGTTVDGVLDDRLLAVTTLAQRYSCIVLLKGARSLIATPEGLSCVLPFSNPAMGTAGSGDVLAGMIAALSGMGRRCLSMLDSVICAGFVHGLAAEALVAERGGWHGILAGEFAAKGAVIINELKTGRLERKTGELVRQFWHSSRKI